MKASKTFEESLKILAHYSSISCDVGYRPLILSSISGFNNSPSSVLSAMTLKAFCPLFGPRSSLMSDSANSGTSTDWT